MATFKVDIEKLYQNRYWTNVYYVGVGATLSDAVGTAAEIVAMEKKFHADLVTFTKYRVSTITPGDFVYQTVVLNEQGARNSTGMDFLPLFNVARVDLTDEGFKRPERKYYRCPVAESDQSGGTLSNTFITLIEGAFEVFFGSFVGALVGPNAEAITSAQVYPFVGMRQLRRGSRRRTTAIIP